MVQSVIDALTELMKDVAGQPEKTYEVMAALTSEIERANISPSSVESMRRSTRAVGNMIGMEADSAWNRLGWRERFRNRGRQKEWKQEYTEELLAEGRRLVSAARAASG